MKLNRRHVLTGAAAAPMFAGYARSAMAPPSSSGITSQGMQSSEPPPISEAIAHYCVETPTEAISEDAIRATKLRVLDLIGCAIGGVVASGNAALANLVEAPTRSGGASLIGYRGRGSVSDVAMANAIFARSYDFEVMTVVVGSRAIPSHHSPTTCMTAMALAEQLRCTGREFLAALTIGDDVAARLLAASGLDFGQGWDGSSVYSALGAVAAAARLRRLNARQTRDAMGLAVNQIGGTIQGIWDGALDFKLPQGAVARSAIESVELAARGWTSMGDPLLAPFALYRQYTAGCTYPELLTHSLGEEFYAEQYFKPYPVCMAVHPVIDCALALRDRLSIVAEDIDSVTISLQASALSNFCAKPFAAGRSPQASANFSYVFQAANALVRGRPRQTHYSDSAIADSKLTKLIAKIELAPAPPTLEGLQIEVRMRDGSRHVEQHGPLTDRHPFARGSTPGDISTKFHEQVAFSDYVPRAHGSQIEGRIQHLEREPDMSRFVAMLTRYSLPI